MCQAIFDWIMLSLSLFRATRDDVMLLLYTEPRTETVSSGYCTERPPCAVSPELIMVVERRDVQRHDILSLSTATPCKKYASRNIPQTSGPDFVQIKYSSKCHPSYDANKLA